MIKKNEHARDHQASVADSAHLESIRKSPKAQKLHPFTAYEAGTGYTIL
jgi:hypothetical protein